MRTKIVPPVVTPALRLSAARTRDDLGPTGTNYPDIRYLLDWVEAAINAHDDQESQALAALENGLQGIKEKMQKDHL